MNAHPGGNNLYWQDEIVERYEYQQTLHSEKKAERLTLIVRMIRYFCNRKSISSPNILDIGCGPGTTTTLCKYILEGVPASTIIGIDSSEQMVEVAKSRLNSEYGDRFIGYTGDFNKTGFWIAEIDRKYDFIVSFSALHYLSDLRMEPFIREVYEHTQDDRLFIAGIGNRSNGWQIAEMEDTFRLEYGYSQLEEIRGPLNFQAFKTRFEEADKKANINWISPQKWQELILNAGFKEVDTVYHLWLSSIFIALK